jgi:hypothetical protein
LVFKDISRLAQDYVLEAVEALLVYLTSGEMAGYFANPKNGLADFFSLPVESTLIIDDAYLAPKSRTLRSSAGAVVPCTIEAVFSSRLANDHELRVFGVSLKIT